jgi:hypothetical protein
MAKTMTPAERFFWTHAGYSYGQGETKASGRRRSAEEMAKAEQDAERMGWTASWEWDDMPWDGDVPAPHEVLGCVLKNDRGEVLASLWGIGDPDKNYRRVIEAELALEARGEIINAVLEAI